MPMALGGLAGCPARLSVGIPSHATRRKVFVRSRQVVRGQAGGGPKGSHSDGRPEWWGWSGSAGSRWHQSRGMQAAAAAIAAGLTIPLGQGASHARNMTSGGRGDPPNPDKDTLPADKTDAVNATSQAQPRVDQLSLSMAGFMIPHPKKAHRGGEDSFYVATTGRSFGVADGVGGWAEVGVDPGIFSRQLMRSARKVSEASSQASESLLEPSAVLEEAYEMTRHVIGSCTACILCLNGTQINAANLGDSGFMVIRDGKLVFESPAQQHSFNFPYQLGSQGSKSDPVGAAQKFAVDVQPGDILVAGSDGLLDNVFNRRSAKLVWDAKQRGATPGVAAQQLATFASARSRDPTYVSPFAKQALQKGIRYQGGKVDDITVVVAYVQEAGSQPAKPPIGPPPPLPPASKL